MEERDRVEDSTSFFGGKRAQFTGDLAGIASTRAESIPPARHLLEANLPPLQSSLTEQLMKLRAPVPPAIKLE